MEIERLKEELNKLNKKTKLIKVIGISIITITIIIGIVLIVWTYKNRDFGYFLNGESESFKYTNSLFIKANNKYYLMFGNVEEKNKNIESIDYIRLMSGDRLIIGSSRFLNGLHEEKIGYNELFPKDVVKNIDNWYYEISYTTTDGETKKEILQLDSEDFNSKEVKK